VQGSGATDRSHATGKPFDEDRVSDYDIALVSPILVKKAEEFHIKLSGPLLAADIERLGLAAICHKLSQMTERPVNFLIVRGASAPEGILVP
jgi:filamentous hemagglutinin